MYIPLYSKCIIDYPETYIFFSITFPLPKKNASTFLYYNCLCINHSNYTAGPETVNVNSCSLIFAVNYNSLCSHIFNLVSFNVNFIQSAIRQPQCFGVNP